MPMPGLGPNAAGYLPAAAVWAASFGIFIIDRRASLARWCRRKCSDCAERSGMAFVVIGTVLYSGPERRHLLGNLLQRI